MTDQQILQLVRTYQPNDIPIGGYVVDLEGRFVACSKPLRKILGLPLDGPVGDTISSFYQDPNDRSRLLARLREAEQEGGWLEKEIIAFKTRRGKRIYVQNWCRSVRNPQSGETIGYFGCLVDVTAEEQYRRLFEQLPAGTYRLDEDNRVAELNDEAFQMLGYENAKSEIIGKPVRELYAEPERYVDFSKRVANGGRAKGECLELLKRSGESVFLEAYTVELKNADETYAGREGILLDATTRERYRRILDSVPVGTYVVRADGDRDTITDCNKQLEDMFEFPPGGAVGFNIRDLYSSVEDVSKFKTTIENKDEAHLPLLGYELRVTTRLGKHKTIEVNSRLVHRPDNRILG